MSWLFFWSENNELALKLIKSVAKAKQKFSSLFFFPFRLFKTSGQN